MEEEFNPLFSLKIVETTPDIASTWCKGFLLGLNLWSDEYLEKENIRDLLLPIIILADTKLILDSMNEKEPGKDFSDDKIEEIRKASLVTIPASVLSLRHTSSEKE